MLPDRGRDPKNQVNVFLFSPVLPFGSEIKGTGLAIVTILTKKKPYSLLNLI